MPTPLIPNGRYKISNAKFVYQDADLLLGKPTADIGGCSRNPGINMVWHLENVGNGVNQFILKNDAPSSDGAHASFTQIDKPIHGGPYASVWNIVPTPENGKYWILASSQLNSLVPVGLVWSLADGNDFSPIMLVPLSLGDHSQVWTFNPQKE